MYTDYVNCLFFSFELHFHNIPGLAGKMAVKVHYNLLVVLTSFLLFFVIFRYEMLGNKPEFVTKMLVILTEV